MAAFGRGLSPKAWQALSALSADPSPNWWRDLLALWAPSGPPRAGRRLRLALRNGHLNFYLKGQSVAQVGFDSAGRVHARVHAKYAFDGAREQAYAKLSGARIVHQSGGLEEGYRGLDTLRGWMAGQDGKSPPALSRLVREVAEGRCALTVDPTPRLIVFGDQAEFAGGDWPKHEAKLREAGAFLLRLPTDAYRLTAGAGLTPRTPATGGGRGRR